MSVLWEVRRTPIDGWQRHLHFVSLSSLLKDEPTESASFDLHESVILLMEEILHQLTCSLPHYLQDSIHPRWCRISSINSINRKPFGANGFPRKPRKPLRKLKVVMRNMSYICFKAPGVRLIATSNLYRKWFCQHRWIIELGPAVGFLGCQDRSWQNLQCNRHWNLLWLACAGEDWFTWLSSFS